MHNILKLGHADNKSLQEPYIHIGRWKIYNRISDLNTVLEIRSFLSTRYGDCLELSYCELTPHSNLDVDRFIAYESNRIRKQFPGLKIIVDEIPDITYPESETIFLPIISFPIDTSAADINLNLMKKYIDPASGKLYLLPDENNSSDIVYTVYNDATLNDYTIKNKIENMESVTGIDLDAMREAYRIIAL